MIVRIGAERTLEQFALASLLDAIWDTYGAGVPSRRVKILRALLVEAEEAEAAMWRWSAQADITSLAPVAEAR